MLILFKCPDEIIGDVYLQLIESRNRETIKYITATLSDLICMGTSTYSVGIFWSESQQNLNTEVYCTECNSRKQIKDEITSLGPFNAPFQDLSLKYKIASFTHSIITTQTSCSKTRINIIKALPSCTRHLGEFQNADSIKMWMVFIGDDNKEVRKAFAETLFNTVRGVLVTHFVL